MTTQVRYHAIRPENPASFASMTPWGKWVFILLIGSAFGRTFYYIGVPQAKVFLGEITLACFMLLRPRVLLDNWFRAITERSPLTPFAVLLFFSVLYGAAEVGLGLSAGYPVLIALQNVVFNLYPVYFFLGLWVGAEHPTMLQKTIRWWGFLLAVYGPLYTVVLNKIRLAYPGAPEVPLFPQPGGGGIIMLGLLALERRPGRFWPLMVFAATLLLATQVRAEWLGTIVAFVIWGLLERKIGRVAQAFGLIAALLLVGYVTDFSLPGAAERGGSVSSREIVARAVSSVDPELAQDLTASKNTGFYAGTISWRTHWWAAIWDSVSPDYGLDRALLGNGYGFPLKDLVPYTRHLNIRTPHNIFYYALGYTGWIGVVLFFGLQAALFGLLWRVYRLTGQSFGIAVLVMTLLTAFFGNSYESPTGAIPFYLLMGLVIGPALCRRTVVLSAPGRGEPSVAPLLAGSIPTY